MNTQQRHTLLARYSAGEITAIDLRRQLDGATFEEMTGWTSDEDDSLKAELDQAVSTIEAKCRPVLQVLPA